MGTIIRASLNRLHDVLNDGLFNGELNRPIIPQIGGAYYGARTIEILFGDLSEEKCFAKHATINFTDGSLISQEIIFDISFVKKVENYKNEQRKIGVMASTMLHEMIHQHLRETVGFTADAETEKHGDLFIQDGLQHGYSYLLGYLYANGSLKGNKNIPEQKFRHRHYDLLPVAEKVIEDFHF